MQNPRKAKRVRMYTTEGDRRDGRPLHEAVLGLLHAPLARVMRRDVPTVHSETPLAEVFQAVIATRLNRAFVVDGLHRAVGLVSDAELIERVTPALRPSVLWAVMHRLPFAHSRPAPLAVAPARLSPVLGRIREGSPVMRETIQRVMAAEDQARRLVESAREEVEAYLVDCRRRARELAQHTEREARQAGAEILEAAAEEARREREDRIRKASAEIEATIRLDEAVAREAAEAIVRCVCGRGRS